MQNQKWVESAERQDKGKLVMSLLHLWGMQGCTSCLDTIRHLVFLVLISGLCLLFSMLVWILIRDNHVMNPPPLVPSWKMGRVPRRIPSVESLQGAHSHGPARKPASSPSSQVQAS